MGVSLERVQFKFASIIGELCSEPDVLSQFAVWLDLRLAEYKLKGSISLDCSGEEPDPVWLKGLNKAKKLTAELSSSFPSHTSPYAEHSEMPQSIEVSERLSPEVVVVQDDVDSVSESFRRNFDPQSLRIRKRSATETSYSSDQWSLKNVSSTPTKQRRLSPHGDSPSNQSLMSVLSGFQGDAQESDTRGDNSSLPGPSSTSSMAARNTDSLNESADQLQYNESSYSNSQMLHDWSAQQNTADGSHNNALDLGTGRREQSSAKPPLPRIDPYTPNILQNNLRRRFIRDIDSLAKTTIKNMVVSAGAFERWLWERETANSEAKQPSGGFQMIFEISPPLLDTYLTEFFATVTTPGGHEYRARSLETLRWGIDRYLKSTGYPHSITTSPIFCNSQMAFRTKLKHLQANDSQIDQSIANVGQDF